MAAPGTPPGPRGPRWRRSIRRALGGTLVVLALLPGLGLMPEGLGASVSQAAGPPLPPPARPSTPFIVGTGNVAGTYFPSGGAICRLVNHDRPSHGLHCLVEPTGGSLDNLDALRRGDIAFGIVQSDWQYLAARGEGPFAGKGPFEGLRAVFSLQAEPFTVLARDAVRARSFADLKGWRVNIGPPGSGTRATTDALLTVQGRTAADFFSHVGEEDPGTQVAALCEGRVDAAVFAVSHPNGALKEAMARCGLTLLGIDADAVKRLCEAMPFFVPTVIPSDLYHAPGGDVPTFGPRALLLTTADTPDAVVRGVVRAVFDHFDDFRRLYPALATLTREDMVRSALNVPLHPAAQAYYRDAGLLPSP
ncbi:TAXI family TRAP transporter solute-binding subunit [Pararhodospirillum oryzae]|uniref:C4-dicarboxylate ABC transporter substrate-binding protein n=1 Tax=Pararhodospirillum oryzae TaxID=478448 RepID=A0A512HBD6_9PROT|nr:TAXI family TRAP transporter solute-binding subunit [Pararhodospirillum oryzae]GEO82767.1 C4-dicarboxylate ABC transporter substrate-binding protein [Pararhodospirillum oryzae]